MKTIINFCPTGMVPTKKITPHVPVTVAEIVDDVHLAWEKGITIVHLHARQADEKPDWRPETYRDIFEGVRKYCPGLIICASTSGRDVQDFERRSAVIELKPDMCSLTLSSLNFINQASVNAPDMVTRLAEKMKTFGVIPEMEAFDLGMINFGLHLQKKGTMETPFYWNLLFGNIAGMQADMLTVGLAVQSIPADGNHYICLAGLGGFQLPVNAMAIANGLGIRIGLEDNIWFDAARTRLATNNDLIRRAHVLMEIHERELMTGDELGALGFYNRKGKG